MPKRLLDDSYLSSPSLARCSPRAQDAFPRFILLADDFGCFEALPRVLAAKGWPHRLDVSDEDVAGWLNEYVEAGMLFAWSERGRTYGYLTGWDGPHGQRARVEYDHSTAAGRKGSKRRTPKPPQVESSEKIPSKILPAREIEIPARESGFSREIPAHAVPVPVPVPDAVPVPPETKKARNPAYDPAKGMLMAVFKEKRLVDYTWSAQDATGLKWMLSQTQDVAEIERRWRIALDHQYPVISTVEKFRYKWNDCAMASLPLKSATNINAPAGIGTQWGGPPPF